MICIPRAAKVRAMAFSPRIGIFRYPLSSHCENIEAKYVNPIKILSVPTITALMGLSFVTFRVIGCGCRHSLLASVRSAMVPRRSRL